MAAFDRPQLIFEWFLKEGRVNTLMTGTRSARRRYSAAGYRHAYTEQEKEQGELYIASVPAGSAQDELRDFNRAGYQVERPWRQTPEPLFEQGTASMAQETPAAAGIGRSASKGCTTSGDAQRHRDIIACVVLGCVVVMILIMWGQQMVQGVNIQHDIEMYQQKTIALEQENEKLAQQLELAKDGGRIRNLAQNKLGMLRPERAQSQTIYIQNVADGQKKPVQEQESPRLGFLDLMLGLLDMLNIGE